MTGFGQSRTWSVAATSAASSSRHATGPADPALGLLGQVVAGRERAAGARDDDDPDVGVGVAASIAAVQRLDELAGERVELGRPVERQPDAPRRRLGEQDRLVRHRAASRTTSASTATAPVGAWR